MSPDARLIAAATLLASPEYDGIEGVMIGVKRLEEAIAREFKPAPSIRGMVPMAYLKDILFGVIARLEVLDAQVGFNEACNRAYAEALNYAKRRLADVEAL